jgi:soluble lytic murein transglycosylase-like protein
MCALWAVPASAQLSSYVDETGNVVFTNPASLPEHRATAKPPSLAAGNAVKPAADVTAIPVRPTAPIELDNMVQKTAERHHVDAKLVRAVISTESNWNASAVSRKGALGLMQLIPTTAQRLGVGNAFDPAQNVDAGVRYLGMLLEHYNGDLSRTLAAYNAGPGAVDRFGGVPNFRETRNYVEKVTANYFKPDSAAPGLIAHGFVPQAPPPIYRRVEADGRVVFTNE